MRILELFAGYGSQAFALKNLGIDFTSDISEIDKYAIQAYNQLHGATHNWGDICKINEMQLPYYDLITYSSPCQDFSVAGLGKGGDKGSGTRSSLLWECERIIRAVKPKYLLMENVKNLVGKKHIHNFAAWLRTLESLGYQNWWKVLNAKDYGVPQNRERVFVVSIMGGGQYQFPEPIPLTKRLKDVLEQSVDEKYYLPECAIADNYIQEPLACASRGRNPDNPSDRTTGSHTEQRIEINHTGCSNTLTSVQKDNYVVEPLRIREATKNGYSEAYKGDSVTLDEPNSQTRRGRDGKQMSNTLTTSCNIGVVQVGNIVEGVSVNVNSRKAEFDGFKPISPALRATDYKCPHTYSNGYRIRKLTPRECWRLMGVKDEQFDKLHDLSNTQLYKMAGNSIVVDVLMGIFKNLFEPTEQKGQLNLL